MKHLDEGTLQAWLDGRRSGLEQAELDAIGRHVDDCDVCTERVAALRASTERAASLLDTGAAVGPPPFAAVQARAASAEGGSEEGGSDARPASARPTAGRPRWRWQSASWAASVAVALGAGWLANDLYRRPGGGGGAMAAADAVVVGESEESVGSRQRAADLDVANDAGAASIEMPPPPSPSAPAEIAEGPVVDAPAPQTAEGPVVVAETEERGDRLETAPDAAVG
ncbi:MAG: hypothetical protein HKN71_07925, partial [Gemmatimonadetes bacterium]|nr:hypothetical protein [Gemmatimonadota bacterium]